MKGRIIRYCCLCLIAYAAIVLLAGCADKQPKGVKIPRLNPKYSYRDKEPMGGYVAYHYLSSLFDYGVSSVISKSFSNLRYEINYDKSLYVIISQYLFLRENDLESMMNYVSSGNTLFISADYIDRRLIDTLSAKMSFNFLSFFSLNEYQLQKKDTWISLAEEPTYQKKYGFFFVPFATRFTEYDSTETQVLGYNENGEPNFIAIDHGQGKFILHAAPAAFSNYFLLTGNNKEYLERTFSYFDKETGSVYWDNYYRLRRGSSDDNFSIVGFFKKHPPLYYALLIVLVSLLIFLAFGGKRKQRFVAEKIPPANTTVSYTETIGRLYLQKKDNRNIALKMSTYFLEQVRNTYFLNTQNLNDEFTASLSRKSGVPEVKVKRLLLLMDDINQAASINDLQLLELHNLIQDYFKK